MKKRTIISIIAGLVILVVVVAAGVHILHKKAYAMYVYKVFCYAESEQNPYFPAGGVTVRIKLDCYQFGVMGETDDGGVFVYESEDCSSWEATVYNNLIWELVEGEINPKRMESGPGALNFQMERVDN
ncbi:MAG: hypothetical protein FJY65_11820 [Calditrichaeota bacterium]|nr:hypothetical protein [Calditrichota bacterium]